MNITFITSQCSTGLSVTMQKRRILFTPNLIAIYKKHTIHADRYLYLVFIVSIENNVLLLEKGTFAENSVLLKGFGWSDAELCPKKYIGDRDPRRWGKRETLHLTLHHHHHHHNDFCIKMVSDESHFNISLIVRDKVTRQCPQTTTSEVKGEPKWNRTAVLLFTGPMSYR